MESNDVLMHQALRQKSLRQRQSNASQGKSAAPMRIKTAVRNRTGTAHLNVAMCLASIKFAFKNYPFERAF